VNTPRRVKMIGKMLIRAPIELKQHYENEAKQKGLTLNALLLQILWQHVENKQKENGKCY
jgi:predicted HicB family RNase H-like nuclease